MEKTISERQELYFGRRYVGASMAKVTFNEYIDKKIVEYMDKPRNFLVFLGNPGIGKTYFLAALVPWALSKFNCFRYYKEADLLKRLRTAVGENHGDYLEALKYLIDDDLIMLDDMGSQGLNDWREEVIFDAIDQRYNSTLPTILTSNFTKEEFHKNYHERIASRVFAKENTVISIFDNYDLRKEGK